MVFTDICSGTCYHVGLWEKKNSGKCLKDTAKSLSGYAMLGSGAGCFVFLSPLKNRTYCWDILGITQGNSEQTWLSRLPARSQVIKSESWDIASRPPRPRPSLRPWREGRRSAAGCRRGPPRRPTGSQACPRRPRWPRWRRTTSRRRAACCRAGPRSAVWGVRALCRPPRHPRPPPPLRLHPHHLQGERRC